MKFSVGYQPRADWVDAIVEQRASVHDVYFSYGDAPSGRAAVADVERQLDDLARIADAGIALGLLFNANCYGDRALSKAFFSEVGETIDGRLQVKAEDTLSGKPLRVTLDLLVLMAGMACNPDIAEISKLIRLDIDTDGFLKSRDNVYSVTESTRPGVFYAGACLGAKTVPETLAEARSAASNVDRYLKSL